MPTFIDSEFGPIDVDMLAAVRVEKSPWVPPGQIYIVGEFPKPITWPQMTEQERIEYAVTHGAIIVIKG